METSKFFFDEELANEVCGLLGGAGSTFEVGETEYVLKKCLFIGVENRSIFQSKHLKDLTSDPATDQQEHAQLFFEFEDLNGLFIRLIVSEFGNILHDEDKYPIKNSPGASALASYISILIEETIFTLDQPNGDIVLTL